MGLGSLDRVGLADARLRAEAARQLLGKEPPIDPIEERQRTRDQIKLGAIKRITFAEAAARLIESKRAGWKNEKHAAQWVSTLENYAYPVIGALPVADVDKTLILKILEPIWTTKNETASRLRGRIEAVLDWAAVHEYRTGENPARWSGHLEHILAAPGKVQKTEHHAALPFTEIVKFITSLRQNGSISAYALEFLILTACRTSEVLNATWAEFDEGFTVWEIPSARMKAGKEHRVPLSDRARAILVTMKSLARGESVFEGDKAGKPLSNMALLMLMRRMGHADLTAHGFRSTFRDWAGEVSSFPREVIEHALAHQLKDKAEASYARGSLFTKRQMLMQSWATYCEQRPDNVVTLAKSA